MLILDHITQCTNKNVFYPLRMSNENENIKIYIHLLSDINMKQLTLENLKKEIDIFLSWKGRLHFINVENPIVF